MKNFVKMLTEKFENCKWYERIKFLRNMHSWSIKQVAEKCIITEKCFWKWEAGKSIPSKRNKKRIAAVFGVKEELIFG